MCPGFLEDATVADVGGKPMGCYRDNQGIRILRGFVRQDWELNSPMMCTRMCSKAGFSYAGVEQGGDCYCGKEPPVERHRCSVQ